MNGFAMWAGPQFLIIVESSVERRQIIDDGFKVHLGSMNQTAAFETVPFNRIENAFRTSWFDHQTDRPFLRTLR